MGLLCLLLSNQTLLPLSSLRLLAGPPGIWSAFVYFFFTMDFHFVFRSRVSQRIAAFKSFFIVVVFESYFIKIYSRMPSMWLSPKTDKNGIFLENMVWLLSSNSYPSVPVRTLTSEFQNHLTFLLGLSKKSSHSILWNHVWELLKILKMSPLKNGCLNHTRITHFRDIAFANPWWERR